MTQRNYLSSFEINTLMQNTSPERHSQRNHCMIMMAFLHGLRVSELLTLKLSDVDLLGRSLHVKRLKNGFSTIQPLLPDEIKHINRWLEIRATFRDAEQNPYLFISREGKHLSRQQFYHIIRRAGKRANLVVAAHPHMLRHSCGYALADSGIDTRLIQDYLGHRNIRHTVVYTASNVARFKGIWRELRIDAINGH